MFGSRNSVIQYLQNTKAFLYISHPLVGRHIAVSP